MLDFIGQGLFRFFQVLAFFLKKGVEFLVFFNEFGMLFLKLVVAEGQIGLGLNGVFV
ncbi:MAG: hypothetical protein Q8Q08_10565 [Candidatus Omnitrophota bacterium]|nr:hypothetical protein [Candidatus Omnitrophota bacterium]MDZ4242829.1 hypothetical protein [Candidatus Omnitrophota bacterium]